MTTTDPLPVPGLELAARFEVELGTPAETGETSSGRRRIVPVVGGRVDGPALSGTVLPGGGDVQVVRSDGVAEIDARYVVRTERGSHVFVQHLAIRETGPVQSARCFAGVMRFASDDAALDHLERSMYLATAARVGRRIRIDAYRVV